MFNLMISVNGLFLMIEIGIKILQILNLEQPMHNIYMTTLEMK